MKGVVYYSPTISNEIIVKKIKTMLPLKFKPLSSDILKRKEELEGIIGRAAYIWGDGTSHHESYFFTRNKIKMKINYDYHRDYDREPGYVTYFNHMYYAEKDGAKILTLSDVPCEIERDRKQIEKRLLNYAAEIINETKNAHKNSIALTIDCDAIKNFPAIPYWSYEDAPNASNIIRVIKELKEKIALLDMGGLIARIDDFDIIKKYDIEKAPTREETKQFLGWYDYLGKKNKKTIKKVGNYALHIYVAILASYFSE